MDKTAKNGSVLVTQAENNNQGNQIKIRGKMGLSGGGADQDRTGDLLNAIQALSQLSYSPTGNA